MEGGSEKTMRSRILIMAGVETEDSRGRNLNEKLFLYRGTLLK